MPVEMNDVLRILGPVPIIDPTVVMTEIMRRYPLGGQELDGLKKDMIINKVIRNIIEQPQISGLSKWEDRFLHKCSDGGKMMAGEKKKGDLMRKSYRPLRIAPNEHELFFNWLKEFGNSPWSIENVDPLRKSLSILHPDRGLMEIPFEAAMNYLSKSLRWSDSDVFEYWDFRKSQISDAAHVLYKEAMVPGGFRLRYLSKGQAPRNGGYVDVRKVTIANKSFIAPDLRGREAVQVLHRNIFGRDVELGTLLGMDAMQKGYEIASDFANTMADKLSKGDVPQEPTEKQSDKRIDGFKKEKESSKERPFFLRREGKWVNPDAEGRMKKDLTLLMARLINANEQLREKKFNLG